MNYKNPSINLDIEKLLLKNGLAQTYIRYPLSLIKCFVLDFKDHNQAKNFISDLIDKSINELIETKDFKKYINKHKEQLEQIKQARIDFLKNKCNHMEQQIDKAYKEIERIKQVYKGKQKSRYIFNVKKSIWGYYEPILKETKEMLDNIQDLKGIELIKYLLTIDKYSKDLNKEHIEKHFLEYKDQLDQI